MKTLKQPTQLELLVDQFLESDWSLYIGGAMVGFSITYMFYYAMFGGI